MKIYFAGSIFGGRNDAELYKELILHLQKYGTVLTEHVGGKDVQITERDASVDIIHDRDMEWLLSADVVIAEVSTPSLGVGYEIGRAIEHKKKIICLYRPNEVKRLSAMIAGSKDIVVKGYETLDDAKKIIDELFG